MGTALGIRGRRHGGARAPAAGQGGNWKVNERTHHPTPSIGLVPYSINNGRKSKTHAVSLVKAFAGEVRCAGGPQDSRTKKGNCTGFFSHNVHDAGFNCPTIQSSLNYLLLAFYCACISRDGLHAPWWRYVLLAVADVEANYLIVKSFQYTSTTSVLLLDSFAIPCAMVASVFSPMKAVYSNMHLSGVGICVMGLAFTIICDAVSNGNSGIFPEAWKGDLMCLVGASLYGLSNVLQEEMLKQHGQRTEILGMLGVFGFLISGCQATLLERRSFGELTKDAAVNIVGYQLSLFSMYSLTSIFLDRCDACLFNLSLLTSDLYTLAIASVMWKEHFMPILHNGVSVCTNLSEIPRLHPRSK